MTDVTDPNVPIDDYDALTDEELLERCRRARSAEREMELVRGLDLLGVGDRIDCTGDRETRLVAEFMHVFHPDDPRTPETMLDARELTQ